ncbi:MAG TPA: hypothetical protein GX509_08820 [Firmicutes bacterium]|nr:hypothetical protein [Bacillota bacterium]
MASREGAYIPHEAARFTFDRIERAHDLLGVPPHLDMDVFNGAHQFSGRKAFDWMGSFL